MSKSNISNFVKDNYMKIVLYLALAWFLISFIIFPNLNIVYSSFFVENKFSTVAFFKLLNSEIAIKALKNSFLLAVSLAITVNALGIFIVLVTEFFDIKGSKFLKLGYMSTLIYGGIILNSGYRLIYGETGIVTNTLLKFFPNLDPHWFIGYGAVLFVMTFGTTSNHIIFLTNAIRGIDYQVIEAAQNMGAKNSTIVRKILLPMLKPTIFALTILTFLGGLGAVSAPIIVGGENFQTINPIVITLSKTTYSRDIAILLSLILGFSTIILLTYMNIMERRGNYISISKSKTILKKQKINNKFVNILVHAIAYILLIIYLFPMLMVILFSVSPTVNIIQGRLDLTSLTFMHYKRLFFESTSFKPYLVSFTNAGLAVIGVVTIALIVSKITHRRRDSISKFFEYGSLIPWLLPGTLIALALSMTYNVPRVNVFKATLMGTPTILILAYIVVNLPFAFRMIRAAFFSVDKELEEAAKSMGASQFYTFIKVILPLLLPAALAVGALIFNQILTDYNIAVFLYHPLLEPLGIAIYKNTTTEVDLDAKALVYVYSVTMMIISSIVIYFVYGRNTKIKKK